MDELKKVKRVMGRVDERAPHEVLLVLDASQGQNALQQARLFNDALASADMGVGILRDLGLLDTDPNTTRLMDVIGRAQRALNQLPAADATYKALLDLDKQQLGTRLTLPISAAMSSSPSSARMTARREPPASGRVT